MTKAVPELPDPQEPEQEERSGPRRSVIWMIVIFALVATGSFVAATRMKPVPVVDSLPTQVEVDKPVPAVPIDRDRNYNEVLGLITKLTRRTVAMERQQYVLLSMIDTTLMAVDHLGVLQASLGTSVDRIATDIARHKLWAANRAERVDNYFLELVRVHNALVELVKELSENLHEHSGYHH